MIFAVPNIFVQLPYILSEVEKRQTVTVFDYRGIIAESGEVVNVGFYSIFLVNLF